MKLNAFWKKSSFYLLVVFPLLLFFVVEAISQINLLAGFTVIFTHPLYFLVTFLFYIGLTFLIYYLSKRFWFTIVCVAPLFVIYAIASAIKASIRELPILPSNLYYVKEIQFIVNFAPVVVGLAALLVLGVVFLIVLLFKKSKPHRLNGATRIKGMAAGLLAAFVSFWLMTSVLPVQNQSLLWKYSRQGSIPTFFQYLVRPWMEKPEALSLEKQAQIKDAADRYTPDDRNNTPDIIVFTLESFIDPLWMKNVETNIDPIENLRKLASGRAIVSSYGGNSTGTDYEALSGDCTAFLQPDSAAFQDFLKKDLPYAFPNMLKENGYTTAVVCAVETFFLNSKEGYMHLGLDKTVFKQQFTVPRQFAHVDRGQNDAYTDYEVAQQVILTYEEMRKENKPVMIYANTFENHYPFELKKFIESGRVKVELTKIPKGLSKAEVSKLTAYIQGLYYADKCIAELMNYFEKSGRNVIIVAYGDHLAGIGHKIDYYKKLGVMSEGKTGEYTYEQLLQAHTVPYYVWDNFTSTAPKLPQEPIAMCHLLPVVFRDYGIKLNENGKFLAYASTVLPDYGLQQWPDYDRGLSEEQKNIMLYYKNLQYNRLFGD